MKAATERKIIRWLHIIASIPIIGYIYGPVAAIPEAVTAVRYVLFPLVILTGLWMWKGPLVKRWFN
jgi:thiosulfate reductase cytochrome b subunit